MRRIIKRKERLYRNLNTQRVMLEFGLKILPQNHEVDLFKMAYAYRRQFEFLAESEENAEGLVAALSRALSFGIDLENNPVYEHSNRGIDTIPLSVLDLYSKLDEELSNEQFTLQLREAGKKLSDYSVAIFFESLDWVRFNYYNPKNLQKALANSFLNYARTATLGLHYDEHGVEVPIVSQTRLKKRERNSLLVREY